MIKTEKWEVAGLAPAIRGMRNPHNSWDSSDSGIKLLNEADVEYGEPPNYEFVVGRNDLDLAMRLSAAGTDHRKYMRMIAVYADITAPLYWWKEFDTYKVGTVANSCSTMHSIAKKAFTLEDFSHEHLLDMGPMCNSAGALEYTIQVLNFWRDRYNETEEERDEYFKQNGYPCTLKTATCWSQMIQLLPSSYNQRRTVMMNYEVLANMYHARKQHKLEEWRDFCQAVERLPCSELITGGRR